MFINFAFLLLSGQMKLSGHSTIIAAPFEDIERKNNKIELKVKPDGHDS